MKDIPDYLKKVVTGEISPTPISKLIGFSLTEVEYGRATFELDAGDQHTNPFGLVHGGLICDIADAAMGAAYHSTLTDDETCSTLELKISFLKPAPRAKLRATGRVIKEGRSVGFVECDVIDEGGSLLARATGTLLKMTSEAEG
ncbi:MAG: PaaI family thioesterase [Dehalococcoidia bacterium]